MKSNLQFNFTVNKEDKTIHVKREFDANLELVWEAWTTAGLLNKWWAPRPYYIETKLLDLREGGRWLYAMVSPDNEKTWCKADYKTIKTHELLRWHDAFCDEDGYENTEKPRSFWTIEFTEQNGITTVDVSLLHDKLEDVESMIRMGFREGFTMALDNLDEVLLNANK